MNDWTKRCTIGITTRDRAADLRHTIERQIAVGLGDMHYIIVDDGSADPVELRGIASQLLNCRFIRHEDSTGYVQRRQEMAEACETEFLISLDDDSYFVDISGMSMAIDAMMHEPHLGLVSFRIIQRYNHEDIDRRRTTRIPEGYYYWFRGCGYVVRVRSFLEVGGYPSTYRHGAEELHLLYQFFRAGISVLHVPNVVIEHKWTWAGRPKWTRARDLFRSQVILKLFNEPIGIALLGVTRLILWLSWHGHQPFLAQFAGGVSGICPGLLGRFRTRPLTLLQYLQFRRELRNAAYEETAIK
jgi:GT2 family glycosyltransferase